MWRSANCEREARKALCGITSDFWRGSPLSPISGMFFLDHFSLWKSPLLAMSFVGGLDSEECNHYERTIGAMKLHKSSSPIYFEETFQCASYNYLPPASCRRSAGATFLTQSTCFWILSDFYFFLFRSIFNSPLQLRRYRVTNDADV